MNDTNGDDFFLLSRGKDHVKSRPSPATLWRWAMKGVRGVKLDTVLIGGRRYMSAEAFERFTRALNAGRGESPAQATQLRAEQKSKAAERAAATF